MNVSKQSVKMSVQTKTVVNWLSKESLTIFFETKQSSGALTKVALPTPLTLRGRLVKQHLEHCGYHLFNSTKDILVVCCIY